MMMPTLRLFALTVLGLGLFGMGCSDDLPDESTGPIVVVTPDGGHEEKDALPGGDGERDLASEDAVTGDPGGPFPDTDTGDVVDATAVRMRG